MNYNNLNTPNNFVQTQQSLMTIVVDDKETIANQEANQEANEDFVVTSLILGSIVFVVHLITKYSTKQRKDSFRY